MAAVGPGQWNDTNRAFVQAFMAKGSMTFRDAQPVMAAIFNAEGADPEVRPDSVTEEDFQSYLSAATDALSSFDYEIRSTVHQITRERIYAFVNAASDPVTQGATIRTPEELAFIKRLLDAMFETHNSIRAEVMAVSSMQALKAARAPPRAAQQAANEDEDEAAQSQVAIDKGLTSTQAERLLGSLVTEGWLERSREGFYSLSPRALIELRAWLVATYNVEADVEDDDIDNDCSEWQRIKTCRACKEIITVGQRCADRNCLMRLHDVCAAAFWRARRGEKVCVDCQKAWDGRCFVGEKAVTTTDAYLSGRRRSGNTAVNAARSRASNVVAEEEGEE